MHIYDYAERYLLTKFDFKDYELTRLENDKIQISFNYNNLISDGTIAYGKYIVKYDFSKNILGAYNGNQVYISEISPSRTEIKIKPKNIDLNTNTD